MKEIIALLVSLSLAVWTIYSAVTRRINVKLATLFLVVSLIAGLAIANYDVIKTIKWMDLEIEAFEQEIDAAKEEALAEIQEEVENQKQAINLLMGMANNTREEIEKQREAVAVLNTEAEGVKERIESLHQASLELALVLLNITWLQVQTLSEFIPGAVLGRLSNELDKIVTLVIPNPQERADWKETRIAELEQLLVEP